MLAPVSTQSTPEYPPVQLGLDDLGRDARSGEYSEYPNVRYPWEFPVRTLLARQEMTLTSADECLS